MPSDKETRWIVRYRRYSSDSWSERLFGSQAEALRFKSDYLYDGGPDASVAWVKKFVED